MLCLQVTKHNKLHAHILDEFKIIKQSPVLIVKRFLNHGTSITKLSKEGLNCSNFKTKGKKEMSQIKIIIYSNLFLQKSKINK